MKKYREILRNRINRKSKISENDKMNAVLLLKSAEKDSEKNYEFMKSLNEKQRLKIEKFFIQKVKRYKNKIQGREEKIVKENAEDD